MFTSEGPGSTGASLLPVDAARLAARDRTIPDPGMQATRFFGGHAVPFAIPDERSTREAIWKLGAYAETVASLQTVCDDISKRLAQIEATIGHTAGLVAERTSNDLSAQVEARLKATEESIRHIERVVASGPPDELFALQTLCGTMDTRLTHIEETLGHTAKSITESAVHELSARVDARLAQVEDAVRRMEGLSANSSLADLSGRVETRFAQTDRALRRIEAALDGRPAPSIGEGAVASEGVEQVVSATADPPPARAESRRFIAVAAATVIVGGLLLVVALPSPSRVEQPAPAPVVDRQPLDETPTVEEPASAGSPAADAQEPAAPAPAQPVPEAPAPAPVRRDATRSTAAATAPPAAPARFVGDLSITSTPTGASVFVNGRAVGVTPLVLRDQRAGSVAVQISREGFQRWSASVQIPAGQVTRVAATLASQPR